jgi:hypothetical protein
MRPTIVVLGVVLSLLLMISCSEDTSTVPVGGDKPDESVYISGRLSSSSQPLGSPGWNMTPTAVSDYKIIAQGLNSMRIFVVTTETGGAFEFTVPIEDSYTFHILDDNYHYLAPIVLAEYDSGANEVNEGLVVDTSDVDFGDVIVAEDEYVAYLVDGSVVTIDSEMVAAAIDGIPVGADSQGKDAGTYSGNPVDLDGDGVINIMDSDDDGDGLLDEFDPDWRPEVFCSVVGVFGLFVNFHNNLDEFGNPPAVRQDNQYIITVETISRIGEEGKITKVVINGPEYLDLLAIHPTDAMATNWLSYNDRNLIKDYLGPIEDERWGAFIQGVEEAHVWDVVTPGDVWLFEITYTVGGLQYTELAAKKINFIFDQTPENVYIDNRRWTSHTMDELPDTVVITWDIISSLPGMNYSVTGWAIVNDTQYADMFVHNCGIDADSLVFVMDDTTITGDTISYYNIDVVASNHYGDNAKTDGGLISKWSH